MREIADAYQPTCNLDRATFKEQAMPNIDLGQHFDGFVQDQVASGRFRTVSDVVQAGLRLLEAQDTSSAVRKAELLREIDQAFDDPRPSLPLDEVFRRLRAHHALPDRAGEHER